MVAWLLLCRAWSCCQGKVSLKGNALGPLAVESWALSLKDMTCLAELILDSHLGSPVVPFTLLFVGSGMFWAFTK